MKGMRKNVWSEYKKVGLGDFVPKLGVALLAALIILSLAGCKNAVGGGVGSSGGADAGAGAGGSGNRAVHTFHDGVLSVGNYIAYETKTFSEIKSEVEKVSPNFVSILADPNLLGWEIKETGNLVASDEQKFSESTTFVASYQKAGASKQIEKNDLVGEENNACAWYSKEKNAFLIFTPSDPDFGGGDGIILTGKGYVEADSMISDYNKLYKKMTGEYKANGNTAAYKEMYNKYQHYWDSCTGFGFVAFWALSSSDNTWGSTQFIEGMYGDWTPFNYYLSANGKALIDANTGEVAYRRVTIDD